jgi:hypothetical protein
MSTKTLMYEQRIFFEASSHAVYEVKEKMEGVENKIKI